MCFSPRKIRTSTPKKTKSSLADTVMSHIHQSNYDSAIRALYNGSKKAKQDVHKVVASIVQSEVRSFAKKLSSFRQELTLESIDKFCWPHVLSEFDDGLPLVTTVMRSALSTTRSKDKILCAGKKIGPLVPSFGLLMGVILHQRFPSKFKFLQQIISIQMFRSGANHKMFKWFKKFGLCMNVDTTRNLVDKLGKNYDSKIKEWKQDIEEYILGVVPRPVASSDGIIAEGDNGWSSMSDEDMSDTAYDEDNGSDIDIQEISMAMEDTVLYSDPEPEDYDNSEDDFLPLPDLPETSSADGYSVCWDNVQKLSVARHHSRHHGNKMLLWANCFATKDRINFNNLSCNWEQTEVAGCIDLNKFLPSDDDWTQLKTRMVKLVERTLVNSLDLDVSTEAHIKHQYSAESSTKSEVVNLGVVKENPSTCKGVIQIMKYLQRYVPADEQGVPWPIICHGDQLSIERMNDAKIAMSSSELASDRLEGLIPRPQNFHKRVVLLQGTLDQLYGKGAGDKGTLTQIKNYFGHRMIKKKASECMNHLTDFMDFVTEGHLLLLAAHLQQSDNLDQLKADLITQEEVEKTAKAIVHFIWPQIDEYMAAIDDERKYTCTCNNEDGGDEWIECSSTMHCETRWFHQQCVVIPEGAEEDDWWCSEECKRKGRSAYCCGIQKEDDKWINCDSYDNCIRGQWFHSRCIGLENKPASWYCSEVCRTGPEIDNKQAYAMNVLWRGLMHQAERDAERENDGEAMLSMWKINMLEFWEFGHYKYLTLAHRLIASVNGWMPDRIRHNLVWNSTANLRGEEGANIPLDLLNEFLNNEFKTNLKRVKGQYTDSAVQRCSLISGTVGKGLEEKFMSEVMDKYVGKGKHNTVTNKRDIKKFFKLYNGEKLFSSIPGRHHSAYENFTHKIPLKQPEKLRDRLRKYAVNLDLQRLMTK